MTKKKIFRLVHLYLGLISGLIVFVEAVTGCCWVFQEEIKALSSPKMQVALLDTSKITPSQAKSIAAAEYPDKAIHGVVFPGQKDAPLEVIFYQAEPRFYYSLFLHPNTGTIIGQEDHLRGFFAFILDGHISLWLPRKIGGTIVAYGTLIFFISIITGLILWWPKNQQKAIKQRFLLDWKNKTRWRRKNFDLHTVLGFYVSAFAIVFVITGLTMSIPWFGYLYYKAVGGEKELAFKIPENLSATPELPQEAPALDRLPELMKEKYPNAKEIEIHYPHSDSASIYVEVVKSEGLFYNADFVFYDQYSLEEINTASIYGKFENADNSDKLLRLSYDLHIGTLYGIWTKILMFLASLVVASMPVTGLLIYLGRKKKSAIQKTTSQFASAH